MKPPFYYTVFVCLILICLSTNAVTEDTWTNYKLSNFKITDIAFEEQYVWCATKGAGVFRYDTTDGSCVLYGEETGLSHNTVYSIAIDHNNVKWFGTFLGVTRYDDQTWKRFFGIKEGMYAHSFYDITVDTNNVIWCATSDGITCIDENEEGYPPEYGSGQYFSIAIDENGNKWITNGHGLSILDSEVFTPYPGLTIGGSIVIDHYNDIWIGTAIGGVFKCDREEKITYAVETGLANHRIYDIAVDNNNVKWFATHGGVVRFDGDMWKTYTVKDGLVHNEITSIAVDNNNDIWIGTSNGMLMHFNGNTWKTITINMLYGNQIKDIVTGNDERTWFATIDGGVSNFDGETWETYLDAGTSVYSMAVDSGGVLWFAGSSGLLRFDGIRWENIDRPLSFHIDSTASIAIDSNNVKWLTSRSRIGRLEGETLTVIRMYHGTFYCIAVDIDDKVWIGSNDGLFQFDGETWTKYTTKDGLAGNRVLSITIDSDGVKWFACSHYVYPEYDPEFGYFKGVGVSRFDGETWTTYTTKDGLASNEVNDIAIDNDGVVWFATDRGVSRYDGETWSTYTTANGLVHNTVTTVDIDIDGSLWFGTKEGISHFSEMTGTFITKESETTPSSFTISAPYPNPFNPRTTINYSIRQQGNVCLSIYDVLGRKVDTLTDREHGPGNYSATWNAQGFSSGLYFYRIEIDGDVSGVGKMMLMK